MFEEAEVCRRLKAFEITLIGRSCRREFELQSLVRRSRKRSVKGIDLVFISSIHEIVISASFEPLDSFASTCFREIYLSISSDWG